MQVDLLQVPHGWRHHPALNWFSLLVRQKLATQHLLQDTEASCPNPFFSGSHEVHALGTSAVLVCLSVGQA